jgi:hypothetical protein
MGDDFDVSAFVSDIIKVALKKDKKRIANKEYYEKNKQYYKEYQKEYAKNNKDKIKEYKIEYQKEYNKSPEGIKSNRISGWKQRGIITDDYDALYDHYLKTSFCDICRVELTYDRHTTATTKCCDHDHTIIDRPNFRNILCHVCNIKRK